MIKQKLRDGTFLTALSYLYPSQKEDAHIAAKRYLDLVERMENRFGTGGTIRLFSAPGRTELGGNHTDHQHGHVLAASVNLDMIAAVRPQDSLLIEIDSEGFSPIVVDLHHLTPLQEEKNTAAALVRGIAAKLISLGYPIKGFQASISSDVWQGSGLSSSAAFEVLIGCILNSFYCNEKESLVSIAQIGQYAENVFFGKPCGLMDQTASAVGGFVSIDFQNPSKPIVERIPFDFSSCGHALCIVNTRGSHADLTGEYAAVPQEMCAVANYFGEEVLRDVPSQQVLSHIKELRSACSDRAVLRAIHFYDDDANAQLEAEALKKHDFDGFLKHIRTSGLSSALHLQNTYAPSNPAEQSIPLALALCQKILGEKGAYRVHGGGFAGTIQAFVPFPLLSTFQTGMDAVFGEGSCHALSIRPVGGIELKETLTLPTL
ncbi:MAG: galactokinase [Epulopiscium sp.]|jgi:galactokinase|nr:galactokinase [Candidatus Epulonipiscium sp.]